MQSTVPRAAWTDHRAAGHTYAVYPSRPAAPPRTLLDILEATAVMFPAAPAIDDGVRLLTYSALLARLHEIGSRIGARGIGRGDRIGIRVPSGTADLYVAILAVLVVGAAYVPVDVDDPYERAEEMWLAWRHGGWLVPAPRSLVKTGADLGAWLVRRRISVVSTVPTLAALWPPEELRGIRLLILGGEACPPELAARLASICPEVWNTYGPTETTVVASAARLTVNGPVRIGLPLDGWQLAVLDPHSGQPVGWGEAGELVIGAVGMARYLDPAKDAAKFGPVPALGWTQAYRSGDMVRADPEGPDLPRTRGQPGEDSGLPDRAGRDRIGAVGVARNRAGRRDHLPAPAPARAGRARRLLQPHSRRGDTGPATGPRPTAFLPSLTHGARLSRGTRSHPDDDSGKADRKSLPPPRRRQTPTGAHIHVPPTTPTEAILAEELAAVINHDQVSVDAHFFDDLGANSLTLAHFCARARQRRELPSLAIKDVYLHPTIRTLAMALPNTAPASGESGSASTPPPAARRTSTGQYVLCGAAQLLLLIGAVWVSALVVPWRGGSDDCGADLTGRRQLTAGRLPSPVPRRLRGRP